MSQDYGPMLLTDEESGPPAQMSVSQQHSTRPRKSRKSIKPAWDNSVLSGGVNLGLDNSLKGLASSRASVKAPGSRKSFTSRTMDWGVPFPNTGVARM